MVFYLEMFHIWGLSLGLSSLVEPERFLSSKGASSEQQVNARWQGPRLCNNYATLWRESFPAVDNAHFSDFVLRAQDGLHREVAIMIENVLETNGPKVNLPKQPGKSEDQPLNLAAQILPTKASKSQKTYQRTAKDMSQYPNCFCRTVMRRPVLGYLLQSRPPSIYSIWLDRLRMVKASRDKSMLHSFIGCAWLILLSMFSCLSWVTERYPLQSNVFSLKF